MAATGGQSLSLSSNVPLLNYQPGLYQQATINIPGLTQQGVPLQTRPTQLCAQTEPFQQTLIVCPPTIQGENDGTVSPSKKLCFLSFAAYYNRPLAFWCRSSNLQQTVCLPGENG